MQLLHSATHTYEIMWQAVTQLKGNFSPVLVQLNFHFFQLCILHDLECKCEVCEEKKTCSLNTPEKVTMFLSRPAFL